MELPTGPHPVLSPFFCSHRTLFSALPGSHGAWWQAEFRRSAPPRSFRLDHRSHSPLEPYCYSATSRPSHRWKGRQSRPGDAHSLHGSATAAVSVFHLFCRFHVPEQWPTASPAIPFGNRRSEMSAHAPLQRFPHYHGFP